MPKGQNASKNLCFKKYMCTCGLGLSPTERKHRKTSGLTIVINCRGMFLRGKQPANQNAACSSALAGLFTCVRLRLTVSMCT